ncbi:MAG: tetratricopeptide repeat protein [Verrucomicrobiota bacterium]
METIPLKDLDPRLQKQIENARKAIGKNPTYATDIMLNIVKRNPGCLEAREILREAQKRASKGKGKGLSKFFGKMKSSISGGEAKVKKDPVKAMEEAEDMLNSAPDNAGAHKMLGMAAEALELYDTAAFAYRELYTVDPSNSESAKLLMKAYIKVGDTDEAIKVGDAAYQKNPSDDEIQSLIRKASVEKSIQKGKWEEEQSFRDKLKDEEEAQKLEQSSRAQTGEAGLRSLIEEAKKGVEAQPGNLNNYRDLVSHYRKLEEYDNALEWLSKARELESGRADVNLERLDGTIQREKMTKAISEKEAALESDPENAALKADLEQLRVEERSFRLSQAEDLVQRYPNEFSYRFELGELYFEDGEIDKTIKELQLALRSPKVRLGALILLGKAYQQKGFFDLASEQLLTAKSEIPGMSEQKKDVLYTLGESYEKQGETEKAIAEFKALYGADISYRDVAEKIDTFYSQKNSG